MGLMFLFISFEQHHLMAELWAHVLLPQFLFLKFIQIQLTPMKSLLYVCLALFTDV